MIRQCCECKRVWVQGRWVLPTEGDLERQDISHGYCETCFVKQMQIIHSYANVARPKAKKSANRFAF